LLPRINDVDGYAIFLDFDGTVVEIEESPDAVRLPAPTRRLLKALRDKSGGALALVSGREIAVLDRMLYPLVLPVAGVHGLQRRDAQGVVHAPPSLDLTAVTFFLEKTIGREPGVLIEQKLGAVAVHYRLRPDLERRCRESAEKIAQHRPDLHLLRGKMVFELTQKCANKGSAIDAFLSEPPFAGRTPIFAGDDVTDEAGFSLVNERGGISIKVGAQQSAAQYRATGVPEVENWLGSIVLEQCEGRGG
jgi:trehalose 6-phosphate phosphatase